MSPAVGMFLISAISAAAGLFLFHIDSRKPSLVSTPTYVEEPRSESWDVVVRLYLSNADGGLKEIGGYMLKHHVDKEAASAEVDARLSKPEVLDAEVKAFLISTNIRPMCFIPCRLSEPLEAIQW